MCRTARSLGFIVAPAVIILTACTADSGSDRYASRFVDAVSVDGSSTVYPITEAVAEEFQARNRDIRVTVGVSGSGGGFRRFCAGETDISDASRPIKPGELAACRSAEVEPLELIVGYDGITLVVNASNTFASCLTVPELKGIWEPGSVMRTWSDVRPEWPNEEIVLYGPGPDSGTFDFFTAAIVGEEDAIRPDFTASEDDNVLVQGVAGDPFALGYFGYAYYAENTDKLNVVAVDDGAGCVAPDPETIQSRKYSPLTRPLFIYVNEGALKREAVVRFVEFYLTYARTFLPEVGYVPLSEDRYRTRFDEIRWRAGQ